MSNPAPWRAQRLAAQGLSTKADDEASYVELFRRLQPVSPVANSYPGSPPRLEHRVDGPAGEDGRLADELRASHRLIKGRFFGGRVSYVHVEDLPLYTAACRRPLRVINELHAKILRAFEVSGPLSPRQLREQTGLAHRPLMAAVNRLEEAFLVCEDQTDDAWDRPLHLFEREWPAAWTAMTDAVEARRQVLLRWAHCNVRVSVEGAASSTGWPQREMRQLLARLSEEGHLQPIEATADPGYTVPVDARDHRQVPQAVRVLHRDDPLVRPLLPQLQRTYGKEVEVLKYLLIDDDVAGIVCGHWRIKPHDVDDILIADPDTARARREEILAAVTSAYPSPERQILQYAGEPL
ncbi:MAG: hypothetical protein ISR77_21035 [Pirellulaceae bacterium]|nr:hypothetical protein [Pirellulaceae bacterium]